MKTEYKFLAFLISLIICFFLISVPRANSQEETIPLITVDNADEVRLLGTFWLPNQPFFLEFSPNGRFLASYEWTNSTGRRDVRLWDMASMRLHSELVSDGSYYTVERVLFSPNSESLLVIGSGEPVEVWDIANATLRFSFDIGSYRATPWVSNVGFSPDSSLVAIASYAFYLWDVQTGEKQAELNIRGVFAFSPLDNLLAIGDAGGVTLFDLTSGERINSLSVEDGVTDILFTPNGETIIARSGNIYDGGESPFVFHLIDAATLTERAALIQEHEAGWVGMGVFAEYLLAHLNRDGNYFAFSNFDTNGRESGVSVANVASGEVRLQTPPSYCRGADVILSADGHATLACTEDGIQVYDTFSGEMVVTIPVEETQGQSFSTDGSVIGLLNCDSTSPVELWDAQSGEQLIALPGRCDYWSYMAMSPDGSTLLVKSGDFIFLYGIPTTARVAYGSVLGRVAPSVINVRAAPSLDAEVTGEISGDVAVGGRDTSGQFLCLSSHGGWVRADADFVDLGVIAIEDLPILEAEGCPSP